MNIKFWEDMTDDQRNAMIAMIGESVDRDAGYSEKTIGAAVWLHKQSLNGNDGMRAESEDRNE